MQSHPPPLQSALVRLRSELDRVVFDDAPDSSGSVAEAIRVRARLAGTITRELDGEGQTPLMSVAIIGGTGAGKSTVLNGICDEQVTPVSALRPTTTRPVWACGPAVAPAVRERAGTEGDVVVVPTLEPGLVLVEVPDAGSGLDEPPAPADHTFDHHLVVTTPTRYGDAAMWDLLGRLRSGDNQVAVIMNKLPASDSMTLVEDLRGKLRTHGLSDVGVIATTRPAAVRRRMVQQLGKMQSSARSAGSPTLAALADSLRSDLDCVIAALARPPSPSADRVPEEPDDRVRHVTDALINELRDAIDRSPVLMQAALMRDQQAGTTPEQPTRGLLGTVQSVKRGWTDRRAGDRAVAELSRLLRRATVVATDRYRLGTPGADELPDGNETRLQGQLDLALSSWLGRVDRDVGREQQSQVATGSLETVALIRRALELSDGDDADVAEDERARGVRHELITTVSSVLGSHLRPGQDEGETVRARRGDAEADLRRAADDVMRIVGCP